MGDSYCSLCHYEGLYRCSICSTIYCPRCDQSKHDYMCGNCSSNKQYTEELEEKLREIEMYLDDNLSIVYVIRQLRLLIR